MNKIKNMKKLKEGLTTKYKKRYMHIIQYTYRHTTKRKRDREKELK